MKGNMPSRYFFSKISQRGRKLKISNIWDKDHNENIDNHHIIKETFVDHYKALFNLEEDINMFLWKDWLHITNNREDNALFDLNNPILEEECCNVINQMHNGKLLTYFVSRHK